VRLPEFLDHLHIKVARLSASFTGRLYPRGISLSITIIKIKAIEYLMALK
jgi:hypothetical protein